MSAHRTKRPPVGSSREPTSRIYREEVRYVITSSTIGLVLVAATDRGVCLVLLGDDPESLLQSLKRRFPGAELRDGDRRTSAWAAKIVRGWESPAETCDVPIDVSGTAFQRQVWEALRAIPPGATSTYAEIARKIGRPKAIRAVGNACGANPVAPIVPCHRVLASDGSLGGYGFGVERKRLLLEREKAGGRR
jgi:AraC family transcriptional regulator of adaptative response/methylated-DNA-[protein]-cysteine methyltransferase